MPIERDEEYLRIIGYNEPIEFYDDSRVLQQKIYLQDDNTLNIGGATIAAGATEVIGGGLQAHALADLSIHTGLLSSDQAPQFLLMDGSRDLIGDLDIDDGSGDSPVLNFIGGTNDDTVSVWLVDAAGGAGQSDLHIKLCDTGTDYSRVKIIDSADTIVLAFGDQGNVFMSDDAYIGIESGGRVAFNSTSTPDEVQVLDADLYLAATGYGIKHIDGNATGRFLRGNGSRYVPDTLDVADLTDLAYATPNLTLGTANAAGAANSVIRSDATILVFDVTVPTSLSPDDSAATGSAGTAARRDHAHGITCAAVGSITPDASAAEGSATSFARSDHTHGITCATAGSITPDTSAAEGTASSFARSDHTHGITCAAPSANLSGATSNSEGIASSFARSDHSHAITTTGADTNICSGTAGTTGNVAMWNADGDLVTGSLLVSDIVDGSGGANRVAIWSDSDTLTSDVDLQFISDTLYVNETSCAEVTIGYVVNQATNDDCVFVAKSSTDVNHGGYLVESDTFFSIQKRDGGSGGVLLRGHKDSGGSNEGAMYIVGYLDENVNTTKSTSGTGIVNIGGYQTSAGAIDNTVANGNVLACLTRRSGSVDTIMLLDEDGDLFIDGALRDLSDTDTYLNFGGSDNMGLYCGGVAVAGFAETDGASRVNLGVGNSSSGSYTTTLGKDAVASLYGEFALSSGYHAAAGDSQYRLFNLYRTDAVTMAQNTWYSLWLDGSSANMSVPTDACWNCLVRIIGMTQAAGTGVSVYMASITIAAENDSGTLTLPKNSVTEDLDERDNMEAQAGVSGTDLVIQVRTTAADTPSFRFHAIASVVQTTYS